jgi:acetylornithine/N-succinyldiaminopimelate aminotransferase
MSRLLELSKKHPVIKEVRGMGMILAMDLHKPSSDVVLDCMKQGVLINGIKPNTLRFLPPLNATKKEIDQVVRTLSNSLAKL